MKSKITALLILMLSACNTTVSPSFSKEKISKEKMVEVLIDIHLAEASFNVIDRNKKAADSTILNEYSSIFKKHAVIPEDFFGTYNYYLANPALLDSAYGELVSRITTLQSQALKSPELKVLSDTSAYKDSLRNQMLRKFKSQKKVL